MVKVLRVTTTSDNLNALRFYQRRGFRITEVRPGAVDESRLIKPSILLIGEYGTHYLRHLESVNRSVPLNQVTSTVRREFERRMAAGEISQRHLESKLKKWPMCQSPDRWQRDKSLAVR
jgi:hypothetical protein